MPEVIRRDVTASGVRLRVTEAGDGPPVVFIHGMFADHRSWSAVMSDLSGDFRVVAPDLPGFGTSEKPPERRFPYGVDAFTEAIADLFGGLRLGRAAVVGHELGGATAITLAAQHPELVSRLVLINSLCYDARPDLTRRIAQLPLLGALVFKQLWGRAAFRAYYRDVAFADGTGRVDEYYESFNSPAARGSALATLRSTLDTRSVVANTSRVLAPTLVVWGRRDGRSPAAYGQRLAREIRGAGFELIDSGPAPHEERPAEVSAVIRQFLMDERPSRA